jgi:RNA polymerase sigma-70 factor, ECF subfamily
LWQGPGNPPVTRRHYPRVAPATDADLAAAARAGDRAAFGTLVERHRPALLRTCRRALGDPAAAAGVAQEAVLQALLGLPSLRDEGAFGPWLCGIGHNLARRSRRTPAPLPLELAPEPSAPGPEAREDGAQVLAAIAALPRGQRDAVALFYLADLSHLQIAARLGISVGAVKDAPPQGPRLPPDPPRRPPKGPPSHARQRPHARRRYP